MAVRDTSVSTLHPYPQSKWRWTPPFKRIPAWERLFWKCFICIGIAATPVYILYNLPHYRGGVGPHVSMLRQQEREKAKAAAKGQ